MHPLSLSFYYREFISIDFSVIYLLLFLFRVYFAVNVVDGEMLTITKVSRLHMAPYLCVSIVVFPFALLFFTHKFNYLMSEINFK